MIAVGASIPPAREPWRSVRVRFPPRTDRAAIRTALERIAKRHGLPAKRVRIVRLSVVTPGEYAYIGVYRGEGSPAERRVFQRVLKAVTRLSKTPGAVPDPEPLAPFPFFFDRGVWR